MPAAHKLGTILGATNAGIFSFAVVAGWPRNSPAGPPIMLPLPTYLVYFCTKLGTIGHRNVGFGMLGVGVVGSIAMYKNMNTPYKF